MAHGFRSRSQEDKFRDAFRGREDDRRLAEPPAQLFGALPVDSQD
jgi:hypothetical protein